MREGFRGECAVQSSTFPASHAANNKRHDNPMLASSTRSRGSFARALLLFASICTSTIDGNLYAAAIFFPASLLTTPRLILMLLGDSAVSITSSQPTDSSYSAVNFHSDLGIFPFLVCYVLLTINMPHMSMRLVCGWFLYSGSSSRVF